MKHIVFILGGRTGGPLMPALAISRNLDHSQTVVIGVKGGFEQKAAKEYGLDICFLPEVKLRLVTFKKTTPGETLYHILDLIQNCFLLVWSIGKSIYLIRRYQPKLIISTGSFLAIPLTIGNQLLKFFHLSQTKLVIHQQDPLPGLAHKPITKYADLLSCTFTYTQEHYPQFQKARLIPNPINVNQFTQQALNQQAKSLKQSKPQLYDFLHTPSKQPVFLIFGGGSGSESINKWVQANLSELSQQFKVLHLTGALQTESTNLQTNPNYLHLPALYQEMPLVLHTADLVMCRAGLGSITELTYLQKPAILVPLPDSHQETNAEVVSNLFPSLHQKDQDNWLTQIRTIYPSFYENLNYTSQKTIQTQLQNYYQLINKMLDNSQ